MKKYVWQIQWKLSEKGCEQTEDRPFIISLQNNPYKHFLIQSPDQQDHFQNKKMIPGTVS